MAAVVAQDAVVIRHVTSISSIGWESLLPVPTLAFVDRQGIAVMLCSTSTVEPDIDVHRHPKGQNKTFAANCP